ncbi:MAG: hypothetical protein JO317_08990, partial [Verrucomicrobiae bacterium]|nr:hypothetical protein [Verrucomicrobiae bacterium]
PPPSSAYILAFENFNYRWHGVEWYPQSNPGLTSYDFILCSDNAYAPTDPNPPSSFYYPDANHVKLVGEANPWYLADPMPPDPGCHVVYADGRVEWKKGRRFGPFYTYDVPPGNGAWWSSFYSRGIVVAR